MLTLYTGIERRFGGFWQKGQLATQLGKQTHARTKLTRAVSHMAKVRFNQANFQNVGYTHGSGLLSIGSLEVAFGPKAPVRIFEKQTLELTIQGF